MVCELATHDQASFVTLTYEKDGSLNTSDWQKFAKRLRHEIGPFRYYQCGEYGDRTRRRHHHAILFGAKLPTRRHSAAELLSSVWGHGHCDHGEANKASIGYVAGYVTKKLTGPRERLYEHVDPATGEVTRRKVPYATMSLRPGIGEPYYRRWRDQIYPRDELIMDGRKIRPPEYFDVLYEREFPDEFAEIQTRRRLSAELHYAGDNAQRRQAGEQIAKAQQGLRTGALHQRSPTSWNMET